ncbi:hypothetical protein HIM_04418 [Hirsutella minnesotensis 3608]|uniref:Haloacid dehalogenase n=1 Tax=Hirsutella minnesotensis 3608 TaxID=1043627 RepID=A0A0F7ZLF6_9HYPO|nr:hypothetical protein HIM_04418 [Hirsutella minnesotensis 3608]
MSPGTVSPLAQIKALTFDVFGTVVDWRTSVVDELALRAHRKLAAPDTSPELRARLEALAAGDDGGWPRFAQAWRKSYAAFTRSFDPSRDAWRTVDQHHRESLAVLLREWGLGDAYSDAEVESLSLVWHRLSPWPDSAEGLHALGSASTSATTTTTGGGGGCGLVTATLSNGNLALLRDLDDFGALGFRELLSAETFGAYKPSLR